MAKKKKQQYRIRNWPHYNSALVRRGSLTLRLDSHSLNTWVALDWPARRGRRRLYTDAAILCALTLRGSTICRCVRQKGSLHPSCGCLRSTCLSPITRPSPDVLALFNSLTVKSKKISHLVIDSTGLKLYGEGEWGVKVHGWARHRTWRKLHLSMDADSQQVVAALITRKDVVDPRALPRLLKAVDSPVERVYADGAYDSRKCYRAIHECGARAVIPPRKGSVLWGDEYLTDRNSNLRGVLKLGAEAWKRKAKYHRRSLVETAIFRLKTIFSDKLRSRDVDRQRTEVTIRCVALNRMTELGMPRSCAV